MLKVTLKCVAGRPESEDEQWQTWVNDDCRHVCLSVCLVAKDLESKRRLLVRGTRRHAGNGTDRQRRGKRETAAGGLDEEAAVVNERGRGRAD
jgi:hypothetical protein